MAVFTTRSSGYKAGVILLFVVTVSFVVGFGAPFWLRRTETVQEYEGFYLSRAQGLITDVGLWMRCSDLTARTETEGSFSLKGCHVLKSGDVRYFNSDVAWFQAVRALECLCLAGLAAACVYAVVINCCVSTPRPLSRVMEFLAMLSGVLGFSGAMVYLSKVLPDVMSDTVPTDRVTLTFSWAFYFAICHSFLAILVSFVIAYGNSRDRSSRGVVSNGGTATGDLEISSIPMENLSFPAEGPAPSAPDYDEYRRPGDSSRVHHASSDQGGNFAVQGGNSDDPTRLVPTAPPLDQ